MSPEAPTPQDVDESEQARRHKELPRYQATLLELGAQGEVDFGTFLRRALKADATLLGVERVSYWVLEHEPPAIRCVALYSLGDDRFSEGLRFVEADVPRYLRALQEGPIIVANDARGDERTRDLTERYLGPLGITSMLDVPVWVRGRLGGVLCHEHMGPRREWQLEEMAFAYSIGQFVTTGLEAEERRKTERALRKSEEQLRLVVDSLPTLIGYVDADQRYVLVNDAFYTWFGAARGPFLGRTVREVVGEENYARLRPHIERVLAGQVARWSEPFGFVRGRQGQVDGTYVPHRAPDGRVVGYMLLIQDVSERKRLEAELRRASDALEHGDPVFVLDRDFRFVLVNQAMERLSGKPRQEMLGRTMWEAFPEVAHPDFLFWREFHRAMDEQVALEFEDFAPVQGVWLEVTVYPTQEGGITVFHRDTSEKRRMATEREALLVREQAAREEAERLARAEAQLREFEQQLLGIVSHDLRNPLSAILVGTQALLRREALDERGTAAVMRIQHSAERGVRMVHDLLDFTRARVGTGIQVTRRPLDLHALVRGVVDELEAVFPEREVRLSFQGRGEGEWDGDRMAQVVSNLLTNALKYSPAGTPVEVRTVGEDGSVMLQVHNLGEPIPPEQLSRIFEPMQRATTQADPQGRSVGLGLYIVRHLVQAHGGTIEVRSTREAGTTFTVRLSRSG